MSNFICPSCGTSVDKLIANTKGLVCLNCYVPNRRRNIALHNKVGCKGEAKNITEADKKHIFNRTIGPDGKTCVCKDNPKKRWNW